MTADKEPASSAYKVNVIGQDAGQGSPRSGDGAPGAISHFSVGGGTEEEGKEKSTSVNKAEQSESNSDSKSDSKRESKRESKSKRGSNSGSQESSRRSSSGS